MLVEGAFFEAEAGVVGARAYGGDYGQVEVAGGAREIGGVGDEAAAKALVLGGAGAEDILVPIVLAKNYWFFAKHSSSFTLT